MATFRIYRQRDGTSHVITALVLGKTVLMRASEKGVSRQELPAAIGRLASKVAERRAQAKGAEGTASEHRVTL